MKKFCVGLFLGLLLGLSVVAVAAPTRNVRLFINGTEATPDVPPQIIEGRVVVPLRFVSESIGMSVAWDADSYSVSVDGNSGPQLIAGRELSEMGVKVSIIDAVQGGRIALEYNGNRYETNTYWIINGTLHFSADILSILGIFR